MAWLGSRSIKNNSTKRSSYSALLVVIKCISYYQAKELVLTSARGKYRGHSTVQGPREIHNIKS